MAPTPEDVVDSLKSTVDKLEARVAELESRLRGDASGISRGGSGGDGMRMILMGPPGAGETIRTSITVNVEPLRSIPTSENAD